MNPHKQHLEYLVWVNKVRTRSIGKDPIDEIVFFLGGIADRNVPEGGARVAGSNNRDLQPIQDIDEMDEGDMFEDRPARNRAEEPAMRNNNPSENAMRAPANRGGLEENERFQPRLEEEGALGNRNRLSGRRKSLRRDRLLDNAAQAEQFGQEVPRRGLS